MATEQTRATARLVGESAAIRVVRQQIHALAAVDTTVLIEGETGTGKELVARAIHEESRRRRGPIVVLASGGLNEQLVASQWFGHARGAFTGAVSEQVGLFERAQGGTLVLDEIGDMPKALQTHLLRVLEEREIVRFGDFAPRSIDVRVVAVTHHDLEQEVARGRFRRDLLYRIRVARITVPPLRHRADDIPFLAHEFLRRATMMHRKALSTISGEAMQHLSLYHWPGNVRELESTMEWTVIRAAGPTIEPTDLPPELSHERIPPPRGPMTESQRRALLDTLKQTGGNRSVAARLLGISRATLYRRLSAMQTDGPRES